MSNLNQNTSKVKPIRFELVDEPEKTPRSMLIEDLEYLKKQAELPKFRCPICFYHFVFKAGDFCDFCIDDIVEGEGE